MTRFRTIGLLLLLLLGALSLAASPASAAAKIATQSPCTNGGDNCFNFGAGSAGLSYLEFRAFTFSAPSKGTAQVTFHGSLLCAASNTAGNKVVDIETQIVNSSGAIPSANQPGGLRLATVLAPNTSQTLSLASTRVFSVTGSGNQTYRFRSKARRIDSGTNCYIYNAAFSVVFIP